MLASSYTSFFNICSSDLKWDFRKKRQSLGFLWSRNILPFWSGLFFSLSSIAFPKMLLRANFFSLAKESLSIIWNWLFGIKGRFFFFQRNILPKGYCNLNCVQAKRAKIEPQLIYRILNISNHFRIFFKWSELFWPTSSIDFQKEMWKFLFYFAQSSKQLAANMRNTTEPDCKIIDWNHF